MKDDEEDDDSWRFDTLPFDILVSIFNYCHAFDLVRLSEVCKRFHDVIVKNDVLWYQRRQRPIATNQASKRFCQRCSQLLCLRGRWHVSNNWESGKCEKSVFGSWKTRAIPWIRVTKDTIWLSRGDSLLGFNRRCFSTMRERRRRYRDDEYFAREKTFQRKDIAEDVTKFVVNENYVVGGHVDGSITFWTLKEPRSGFNKDLRIVNAHSASVSDVDEANGGPIVSGSADGTVKIWGQPRDCNVENTPRAIVEVLDRIWSVSVDSNGTRIAVGSSGNNSMVPPLKILDFECCRETCRLRHRWIRGAGILDMIWENPQILLTCGYDTCVRKWDTRIARCVASWMDPTDAAIYCISSDYRNTIVSGTQYNCKVVLWDQRMKDYIQLYFMKNAEGRSNARGIDAESSPVYSVNFDSCQLYGATDRRLFDLSFSGYDYRQSDYRNIFRTSWSSSSPSASAKVRRNNECNNL